MSDAMAMSVDANRARANWPSPVNVPLAGFFGKIAGYFSDRFTAASRSRISGLCPSIARPARRRRLAASSRRSRPGGLLVAARGGLGLDGPWRSPLLGGRLAMPPRGPLRLPAAVDPRQPFAPQPLPAIRDDRGKAMPRYLAALTIVLMIGMVLIRALVMRRHGTTAFHFGQIDKKDFIIPPFALFYVYIVLAAVFGWPGPTQKFFHSQTVAWIGILMCAAGLALLLWSIVSFGQSFRVGIDTTTPDKLITTGAFAVSRNPIYVAFSVILVGLFLTFPNWMLLVYLIAAVWLFNRQVLREETYMKGHYGPPYEAYCRQVRRYL